MRKENPFRDYINNLISERAAEAIAVLEMIEDGKACDCRNCILTAVYNFNFMVDLLIGRSAEEYHASADIQNGKGTVIWPEDHPRHRYG